MTDTPDLYASLTVHAAGLSLTDLHKLHPQMARRTLQRRIEALLHAGRIEARGMGRARRYIALTATAAGQPTARDDWTAHIPLSEDSRDILAYIDQPLMARKPVGYQRDFLERYEPNRSFYLPLSLRQQLHRVGRTAQISQPAGTYSRSILNRLLIDLSWASSQLEGNTYSRLDTRELIEHGRIAQGKDAIETQMILNHKAAIELLVENIATVGFDRYTLMNLHAALAENLLPNPAA